MYSSMHFYKSKEILQISETPSWLFQSLSPLPEGNCNSNFFFLNSNFLCHSLVLPVLNFMWMELCSVYFSCVFGFFHSNYVEIVSINPCYCTIVIVSLFSLLYNTTLYECFTVYAFYYWWMFPVWGQYE